MANGPRVRQTAFDAGGCLWHCGLHGGHQECAGGDEGDSAARVGKKLDGGAEVGFQRRMVDASGTISFGGLHLCVRRCAFLICRSGTQIEGNPLAVLDLLSPALS